jgi:hypothetical protein
MPPFLNAPWIQYGALGLAFVLTLSFIRAFFTLLNQRHKILEDLLTHHQERERAFTQQFLACVDRNSAALEKVEQNLIRIQIQLAHTPPPAPETYLLEYPE